MTLPEGYILRHPTPDDVTGAQAVLDAAETADTGEPRRHEDDVATMWSDPDCHIESNWWVIAGPHAEIAAVGMVWPEAAVEMTADHYVHPDHRGRGLGDALLDRIETRTAELSRDAQEGCCRRLVTWTEDRDTVRRTSLDGRGFRPTRQYYEMSIDLTVELPPAEWAAGITPRPFRPEVDERAVYEADQEAFSEHHLFKPRAVEDWRHYHVEAANTDTTLWWLAWAGDELAGYIITTASDTGASVGDLAVRKPWRGRGIGRALLRATFTTLRERGVTVARLMVDAENVTSAVRVYEAAGMHVSRRFQVMEKEL